MVSLENNPWISSVEINGYHSIQWEEKQTTAKGESIVVRTTLPPFPDTV